jgi:hypothetical protein
VGDLISKGAEYWVARSSRAMTACYATACCAKAPTPHRLPNSFSISESFNST